MLCIKVRHEIFPSPNHSVWPIPNFLWLIFSQLLSDNARHFCNPSPKLIIVVSSRVQHQMIVLSCLLSQGPSHSQYTIIMEKCDSHKALVSTCHCDTSMWFGLKQNCMQAIYTTILYLHSNKTISITNKLDFYHKINWQDNWSIISLSPSLVSVHLSNKFPLDFGEEFQNIVQ